MGVLRALVGGAWVDVAGGSDEVFIGPEAPTDPGVELWVDSDAPTPAASVPNGMPRGWVGQAVVTANQGPFSAATLLTGLSVTWTAEAGRRYKTSWKMRLAKDATTGAVWAEVLDAGTTVIDSSFGYTAASQEQMSQGFVVESGLSGSVTRKLRVTMNAGAVTLAANAGNRATLLVEDIGGV